MAEYRVHVMTNVTGMLCVGVTNNTCRRVHEHKTKQTPCHKVRHNLAKLVYCDATTDTYAALTREKQIKGWLRARKVTPINSMNPEWRDFSADWAKDGCPPG